MKKKLTQEDYVLEKERIHEQLKKLKERYIADNTEIKPGTLVMVNSVIKCYLKDYTVVSDRIYPVLLQVDAKGKVLQRRYHVVSKVKMEKI